MDAQALLQRHIPRVIEIATTATVTSVLGNQEIADFLDTILADEEKVAVMPPHRPSLPNEDTFWWCVMQLQELCELDPLRDGDDEFVAWMVEQLRLAGGRLSRGEPLPPGLMVGWYDASESLDD